MIKVYFETIPPDILEKYSLKCEENLHATELQDLPAEHVNRIFPPGGFCTYRTKITGEEKPGRSETLCAFCANRYAMLWLLDGAEVTFDNTPLSLPIPVPEGHRIGGMVEVLPFFKETERRARAKTQALAKAEEDKD